MTTPETIPYRPSNGTEGMIFCEQFCDHCRYENPDALQKGAACELLTMTMVLEPSDREYPKEWVQDPDGNNPRCTKYQYHDWSTGEPEEKIEDPANQMRLFLESEDWEKNLELLKHQQDHQTFDDYLGEARERFVKAVQKQQWSTPLRTEAENLLIAFDQVRNNLKTMTITMEHYREQAGFGPKAEEVKP